MTRVVDHPPAAVVFDFDFDTAVNQRHIIAVVIADLAKDVRQHCN